MTRGERRGNIAKWWQRPVAAVAAAGVLAAGAACSRNEKQEIGCQGLTVLRLEGTVATYGIIAQAYAYDGAKVTAIRYDFGDNHIEEDPPGTPATPHNFNPGTYVLSATVFGIADGQLTAIENDACRAKIVVGGHGQGDNF